MNLIYTMAYGEECIEEARLMVNSLRTAGQFDGEIMIFAERPVEIEGATVAASCDLIALRTFLIARYFIGKSMDCSAYEKVMWLDSDVMAVKPIAGLFDYGGFWIASEGPIKSSGDALAFSLKELPARVGDVGYNTGTMIGEAREWNAFCQLVWSQIVHSAAWRIGCHDQSVVNHLMRSGLVEINPLPEGTVYFYTAGAAIGPQTVLVHGRSPFTIPQMKFVHWSNEQ